VANNDIKPYGWCETCKKKTDTLHKCSCGRFVWIEPTFARKKTAEIAKGKREIREHYNKKIAPLENGVKLAKGIEAKQEELRAQIRELEAQRDAEIAAYLAPGKAGV